MTALITFIGVVVAIGGIVCLAAFSKSGTGKKSLGSTLIVLGLLVVLLGNCFIIVPTGFVGVRSTFGQISEQSVPNGFNWKLPFIQDISLVNSKQQDVYISNQVWGESSEKTPVYASNITVTYQINASKAAWICANITNSSDELITNELVASAIKSAMVELDSNSVTVRSKVEPLALDMLKTSVMEKYGTEAVSIIKITINQMDFEASYNEAIAAKSIARQTQERQAIENQTNIAKAEADKKVAVANAEAQAEAAKIAAEADAEVALIAARAEAEALALKAEAQAEANKKLASSLTADVLKSQFYEAWDGKLPEVMSDGTVITNIGN